MSNKKKQSLYDRYKKFGGPSKEEISERLSKTIQQAKEWTDEKANEFQEWQSRKSSLVLGDSIDRIKNSDSPLVRLEKKRVPRHVSTAMVYFAAASGVFASSDEITRFTRDLMDNDNAAIQRWFRRVFNPEEAKEISLWMDTAPGSEYAGGWAHRLTHGHDLDTMFNLVQEHGHTGAVEWVNHVWLRDFWTPHGVPYLPAGSGSVYDWLVDLGVSPETALSLLTINAAEAASGVLLFFSGRRIYRGVNSYIKARDYRNRLKRINELVDEGSKTEALRLIDESETFSKNEDVPHLRLDLAMLCLGQSFYAKVNDSAAWGSRAYMISYELCKASPKLPKEVPYHGDTRVSFHGLAATVIASAYASYVQKNTSEWTQVSEKIQFGIRQFLRLSESQSKGKNIKFKGKNVIGYRPYSALTNLLMALELSIACGSLHNIKIDPLSIRNRIDNILDQLKEEDKPQSEFASKLDDDFKRIYPYKE